MKFNVNLNIMKCKLKYSIKLFFFIGLYSYILYAQDCDNNYTYLAEIPTGATNINNENNCFYSNDIAVINDFISLNNLAYTSPLEPGLQTWITGRLVTWVATYTPNGSNGINQQLTSLPASFGDLTNLSSLYLEWHNLTELPSSMIELTALTNLAISNNYLQTLPDEIGNLINLIFLDLGYNQISTIPSSIGGLQNLEYLYLFNNQLTSLPDEICNLSLIWDGTDASNYPYFASGGNQLCCLVPECVANSSNFEISLDQFYYSFLEETPQVCSNGDMNHDSLYNVLDIVALANCVLANNCSNCAGDMNLDGLYNVLDIVALANCVLANNCG